MAPGFEMHKREYCFIDPKSKAYKPEVRARRLEQARKKGIEIPKDILEMDK